MSDLERIRRQAAGLAKAAEANVIVGSDGQHYYGDYESQIVHATTVNIPYLIERIETMEKQQKHHVLNLEVIIKNVTSDRDQLRRALDTSTQSAEGWRSAWEQKQVELETAAATIAALEARAERLEAVVGITYWAVKVLAAEGHEHAVEALQEADRIAAPVCAGCAHFLAVHFPVIGCGEEFCACPVRGEAAAS